MRGCWLYEFLVWLSHGAHGFTPGGTFREPLSARIGRNILNGGVMDCAPWPLWLRQHFISEAEWHDRESNSP